MSDPIDMLFVDEALCRVIARAKRWMTIGLATEALLHAGGMWEDMEKERRHLSGIDAGQSAPDSKP